MAADDRKELFIAMNEEVRKERLEKYGAITWCEERETMCFGVLTEDGKCKHAICLHDDPKWIAQQERIEQRRKAAMKAENEAIKPEEKNEDKEIRIDIDAMWKKIHAWEEKANSLYRAGERKQADALMNKSRRARRKLWDIQHK